MRDLHRRFTGGRVVIERQQPRVAERVDHSRRHTVELREARPAPGVLGTLPGSHEPLEEKANGVEVADLVTDGIGAARHRAREPAQLSI